MSPPTVIGLAVAVADLVAPPLLDVQLTVKLVIGLPLLAPGVKATISGPVVPVVDPGTARTPTGGDGTRLPRLYVILAAPSPPCTPVLDDEVIA